MLIAPGLPLRWLAALGQVVAVVALTAGGLLPGWLCVALVVAAAALAVVTARNGRPLDRTSALAVVVGLLVLGLALTLARLRTAGDPVLGETIAPLVSAFAVGHGALLVGLRDVRVQDRKSVV